MQKSIKLEELAMFLSSILLFTQMDYVWWVYLVFILTPDIGMIGYVVSTQLGAITYNLFHHKGIAILVGVLGWYLAIPELQLAGIILFGHASMDRMLGYGLKYSDHFKNTHLGKI